MSYRKMLAIVTILVILALTMGACGPQPAPAPTPIPPTATPVPPTATPIPPTATPLPSLALGGEAFRSEAGGYELRYPQGWQYVDFLEMAVLFESEEALAADVPSSPIVLIQAGPLAEVAEGVLVEAQDAQEMAEALVRDIAESGGQIETSNVHTLKVGGEDAVSVDISGTGLDDAGTLVAGRIVTVRRGDWALVVLALSVAEAWGPFVPTFEAMMDSVSLFEPVVPTMTPALYPGSQWAASATASSEYGSQSWAAFQATGAPDTPECGDYETAWASSGSSTVEWLELQYSFPMNPTEVNIYQTYNPSQIALVELIDEQGEYHEIYSGEPEEVEDCPYVLSIPVAVEYMAVGVRITIDQSVLGLGWNEIDAVEMVGLSGQPIPTVQPLEPTPIPEPPEGFVWQIESDTISDETKIASPGGMDIGPDGNLYVADFFLGVMVLSPEDGQVLDVIGGDILWSAGDVDVAADGTIYVTDWGNNAVYAFAPDGTLLTQWGEEGTGDGQFGSVSPDYVAACPDGRIYVADSNVDENEEGYDRIQVFDTDGNYLDQWNIDVIDEYFSVAGMECGTDGYIYLSGFLGGYILVLDTDGTVVAELGEDSLDNASLGPLALGPDGNIYVGTWDGWIGVLDPEGNLLGQWGSEGTGKGVMPPGQFYIPDGITVDAEGYVYVADDTDDWNYITKFYFP